MYLNRVYFNVNGGIITVIYSYEFERKIWKYFFNSYELSKNIIKKILMTSSDLSE